MADIDPIMGYETYGEYVIETVWGTTPLNPAFKSFGGLRNLTFSPKRSVFKERHLKAQAATQHRHLDHIVPGLKEFDWDVDVSPHKIDAYTSYDWRNIFGLVMGNYTNYTDAIPAFTAYRRTRTLNYLFVGCRANRLNMKIAKNELISVTLGGKAKTLVESAPTMGSGAHAAEPVTEPLSWLDAWAEIDEAPVFDNLREVDFEINNNNVAEPRIRDTDPELVAFIKPAGLDISGSLTLDLLDQSWLDIMLAGTEEDLIVSLEGHNIHFYGFKLHDAINYESKPEELIGERLPWTAKTVTVT